MATPEVIAERKALQGIGSDYAEKYGFHDAENYLYKAPKGLTRELVEKISEFKDEPRVDARVPPEGARPLPRQADAHVGQPVPG